MENQSLLNSNRVIGGIVALSFREGADGEKTLLSDFALDFLFCAELITVEVPSARNIPPETPSLGGCSSLFCCFETGVSVIGFVVEEPLTGAGGDLGCEDSGGFTPLSFCGGDDVLPTEGSTISMGTRRLFTGTVLAGVLCRADK